MLSLKHSQKKIADLSGESWVKDTDVTFKVDNKTYGFPLLLKAGAWRIIKTY